MWQQPSSNGIHESEASGPDWAAGRCGAAAGFDFDLVPGEVIAGFEAAWADLADRALEPNLFFEPAFALPAVVNLYRRDKPVFALVWHVDATGRRLRLAALLPLHIHTLLGYARTAVHPYAPIGLPLVDRTDPIAIFEHLLAGLHAAYPRLKALILPDLPAEGAFYGCLQARAVAAGVTVPLLSDYERAVLRQAPSKAPPATGSTKRRKNLRRQRRRLGDSGQLTYRSASSVVAVRAATEAFLQLEARGWKGRRRTALVSDAAVERFARAMIARLAAQKRCRIDSLDVDGHPVAMGFILGDPERAYFWKMAYDETYATNSPGVQFALDLTRAQRSRPGSVFTDSCATANHPMINRIWRDRSRIVEAVVPLDDGADVGLRMMRLARTARALAKRLVVTLRKRRQP